MNLIKNKWYDLGIGKDGMFIETVLNDKNVNEHIFLTKEDEKPVFYVATDKGLEIITEKKE